MISYNRKIGVVQVTADDGTVREWPLAEFEADPVAAVAATGNGITPPEPVLTEQEQKIVALEKRNAALEAVLVEKALVSKLEIDVQADDGTTKYVLNTDRTVTYWRFKSPQVTFDPKAKGPDQDAYNAFLAAGGQTK